MHDDDERWNARYAEFTAAEPTPPMPPDALASTGLLDEVAAEGRALDVACGRGAQAAWAAARGLSVLALDVSSIAVDLTRRAARLAGVDDQVDARVVDLDDGLPRDLGRFDLLICQRFRGPQMYDSFVEHLAPGDELTPGGLAVVTVLSVVGAESPGPFHARADELAHAFDRPDVLVLHHEISDGQESIVVRRRSS
ncbi:MAG: class I SAM-dependent methyltransferase [Actinomycetota bacterium]